MEQNPIASVLSGFFSALAYAIQRGNVRGAVPNDLPTPSQNRAPNGPPSGNRGKPVLWMALCALCACDCQTDEHAADAGAVSPDAGTGGQMALPNDGDGGPAADGSVVNTTGGMAMDATVIPDAGDSATPMATPDAGPPHSEYCGDGILDPELEACDDGPDNDAGPNAPLDGGVAPDPCDVQCRDRLSPLDEVTAGLTQLQNPVDGGVGRVPERYLGRGLTPAAATLATRGPSPGLGTLLTYIEATPSRQVLGVVVDEHGTARAPGLWLSTLGQPTASANPAAAALPDGGFVVAWTDSLLGTPDIALLALDKHGVPTDVTTRMHGGAAGPQESPALVWTGSDLVVAHGDLLSVKLNHLDAALGPIGSEQTFSENGRIQNDVALCAVPGQPAGSDFALAFRSTGSAVEQVVVQQGGKRWRTADVPSGGNPLRPTLIALDSTRIALAFGQALDPDGDGIFSLVRLRLAIIDLDNTDPAQALPALPLADVESQFAGLGQRAPSLAAIDGSLFLAYEQALRSTQPGGATQPGEASVVMGEVLFSSDGAELLPYAPTTTFTTRGAHRNPKLIATPRFPSGALLLAQEAWYGDGPTSPALQVTLRAP